MSSVLRPFAALPGYGVGALLVLLLYAVQSEIRFGPKARTMSTGPADRGSTLAVSLSAVVPVLGFVLAMKRRESEAHALLPSWFGIMPGMPAIAWVGVVLGTLGLLVRLWSVLILRNRYTRTLLTQAGQILERRGPYRFVRHPGYLGSLLCLNGIAMASGDLLTLIASLAATTAAYAYRIRVEDEMLIAQFGASYRTYCGEVGALMPFRSFRRIASEQASVNQPPNDDERSPKSR
jgi:protein-S-isoprenylcysteine O-methyltransferase Ste14